MAVYPVVADAAGRDFPLFEDTPGRAFSAESDGVLPGWTVKSA
jgi:hypothetical protein